MVAMQRLRCACGAVTMWLCFPVIAAWLSLCFQAGGIDGRIDACMYGWMEWMDEMILLQSSLSIFMRTSLPCPMSIKPGYARQWATIPQKKLAVT